MVQAPRRPARAHRINFVDQSVHFNKKCEWAACNIICWVQTSAKVTCVFKIYQHKFRVTTQTQTKEVWCLRPCVCTAVGWSSYQSNLSSRCVDIDAILGNAFGGILPQRLPSNGIRNNRSMATLVIFYLSYEAFHQYQVILHQRCDRNLRMCVVCSSSYMERKVCATRWCDQK